MLSNWVLEKSLESPLNSKEVKPVNPKGNQPWIFIGGTDAEAEVPILWLPDAKSRLLGKDLDAGKDWRQEEKGMTENETGGWHHRFKGHEFERTLGDGEGQGSLACCSPWWGRKEWDTTEQLNNKILKNMYVHIWFPSRTFLKRTSICCCTDFGRNRMKPLMLVTFGNEDYRLGRRKGNRLLYFFEFFII